MKTLVINQPTAMCCGEPSGECKCGSRKGVRNKQPLPQTDWQSTFEQDANLPKAEKPKETVLNSVVRSVGKAKHVPLGIPAWNF